MNIVLFRLISGEEILAELVAENDDFVQLKNAVAVVYHPTESGRMSAGFAPFIPYAHGAITLYNRGIAGKATVKEQMIQEYNKVFSNIVVAPASILK